MDETKDNTGELPNIRTFKHDLAQTLSQEDVSVASVAVQEQQKRYKAEEESVKEIHTSKLLVIITGILFFVGAVILAYVLFLHQSPTQNQDVLTLTPNIPEPLLYADTQTLFELSGKNSIAAYRELAGKITASGLSPNKLEEIIPTFNSKPVSVEEFFVALDIGAPDRLVRFMDKRFMYGIYAFRDTTAFLLIKPTSFGPVYAELLAWENSMPEIFYPLFTNKKLPGTFSWTDEIIRNIDARVARDGTGQIMLLYAFLPNKEELVITSSIDTFVEVLARSQSPKSVVQ